MLALILGGAGAVALTSCGSDSDAKLLPGTTANQIERNLDQVQQLVAGGDCIGAENAVAEVAAEVEGLNDVAGKLKAALEEGSEKLSEVVGRCGEEAEEETESTLESASDAEAEELESEDKAQKAREKTEKQQQKEEEQAEPPEPEEATPQPEGKAKGHEEAPPATPAPAPEPAEEESSGGVSPSVGVE